ncbi:MAG: transcription antitermination factor NusB [Clostridia bacterium]|nr:transcription antitermination factor NusB [Clostridia bacterium]
MNKSVVREEIFKLIYSLEVQKGENLDQINVYLENSDIQEKNKENIKDTVLKIIELDSDLKAQISKNLKSEWNIDRISKINMSILKIAIYEIIYKKIPYKVVVNEAVELAKKYGEETSPSFINGILASVIKDNNIT